MIQKRKKILKVGNSLAVTIPSGLVKSLGLIPGHEVVIVQKDNHSITYKFLNPQQLTFSELTSKTKK